MRTILTLPACVAISLVSAQTITSWTTSGGLPANDLRDVAVAANGDVWLASQNGVVRFDGSTFTQHTTASHPGLANDDVYAIAVMANGDVWAGTDFGVSVFDGSSYTTYTTADGLGDDVINAIAQAPNGDIWIGTIGGATRYNGSTFTAFGSPDIPFGGVMHMAFAANGDVWLSGGLFGAIRYDGNSFTIYTTADGLLSDRIRAIAIDGEQNKWIATSDGISVLDATHQHVADHEHVFILPPPDELNPITDVLIDVNGRIWAGVYVDYLVTVGGVSVYTDGTWDQYEVVNGLAGPDVRALAHDGIDAIWVATSTGLSRITGLGIGMAELPANDGFELYPNPANTQFLVALDGPSGQWAMMHDASGRIVRSSLLRTDREVLDVADLPDGLYMIRIGSAARRLIVRH